MSLKAAHKNFKSVTESFRGKGALIMLANVNRLISYILGKQHLAVFRVGFASGSV